MSFEDNADACPAEVVLFRFAEGLLESGELEALEQHLASCELCSDLLSLAADETAAGQPPVQPPPASPAAEHQTLGRYVILERLGWGAMGIVFRAYDPKLRREVALKQLHASLGPTESERLVREGRTLAQLNHPHVVAVYDVELDGDEPAIVMEMIRGATLDEWLETERSWQEILTCLRNAGRGLSAAHAAGLLHRDFKPANVMVGSDGRVRVTDFGIAGQLVTPPGAAPQVVQQTKTLGTIGTPAYMAPEQHAQAPLTHAADQYAFALTLRQALTNKRPFSGVPSDALGAAKRDGPPPWPQGATWPRRVEQAIDRAMLPNPQARFASMDALLAALRPGTPRRRSVVWAVAALGVGGATAAWVTAPAPCRGAQQALAPVWSVSRHDAVRSAFDQSSDPVTAAIWSRLEPDLEVYAAAWVDQHRDACVATRVRGDQSEALLDKRMACLDRARQSLDSTISILAAGDSASLHRAVDLVDALPSPARCADRARLERSTPIPVPEQRERVQAIEARLATAQALRVAGRYTEARAALNDAAQLDRAGYEPIEAEVLELDAALLELEGKYPAAATTLERGIEVATRTGQVHFVARMTRMAIFLGAREGDFARADAWTSVARGLAHGDTEGQDAGELQATLGAVALIRGDLEQAQQSLTAAVSAIERVRGTRSLRVAQVRSNLAACLMQAGKVEASVTEYNTHLAILEERLGPEHPTAARTRQTLGNAYHAMGRLDEALVEHKAALAGRVAAFGDDHPEVADSHASIAAVFIDLGQLDEAEHEARVALEMSRRHHGEAHRATLVPKSHLARILSDRLEHRESIALYRSVLNDAQAVFAPGSPQTGIARAALGHALLDAGELSEAQTVLRSSLDERTKIFGPTHRQTVESSLALASCTFKQGSQDAALETLRVLAQTVAADASSLTLLPHVQQRHGELLLVAKRPKDALSQFNAAAAALSETSDVVARARAQFGQAQALRQLGEHDESAKAAAAAQEALRTAGPSGRSELDAVTAWLTPQ